MKRFALAAAAAMLLAGGLGDALAANQQVNPNTWRRGGSAPFYGRDDGILWNVNNKIPRLIGNGDGFAPIGPTYYEEFNYGDGLGVTCTNVTRTVYTKAAGDNAACDTTCGNSACLFGLEDTMDDSDDLLACSGATADGCLCMTAPGDRVLQGCGANWESPALGVTLMSFDRGVSLAYVALLAQDIGPDMDATSLDIGSDQTDNDGVEVLGGMYGASGRPMVPSVDPAFQFCLTFSVADVSGTDDFWIGWRDVTETNATFNSYNSHATIGFDAADGDWATETEDDGGGTTTTDISGLTNATDGSVHKACVKVSDAGVVSYTVDGATPTGAVSYTLDAGQGVIPFVHYLHATTSPGEIDLYVWEVSYQ